MRKLINSLLTAVFFSARYTADQFICLDTTNATVILYHLLNVSVQLANKKGFKQKKVF
jgi:hypothetical protein